VIQWGLEFSAGQALVTAEHEGVAYFLHATWLLRRLEACPAAAASSDSSHDRVADSSDQNGAAEGIHRSTADAEPCSRLPIQAPEGPRFIVFSEAAAGGKDTVVRWANASEQQV
jgi:hypothetical protein